LKIFTNYIRSKHLR